MAVHVDNARYSLGRMFMCHMVSETITELHAMADRIGVKRKWFHRYHYNICKAKRKLAINAGAQVITSRHASVIRHNCRLDQILAEHERAEEGDE